MKKVISVAIFCCLVGCAAMNNAVTSDAKVIKSQFDGSYEVQLEPAGAASSFNDNPQSIGAFWTSRSPKTVVLDARVPGIKGITAISFNVDGKIYELTRATTVFTDTKVVNAAQGIGNAYSYQSTSAKGFEVPLDFVQKLAAADDLKIKIVFIDNTYGVSSCGKKYPMCAAGPKLADFVQKVEKVITDENL